MLLCFMLKISGRIMSCRLKSPSVSNIVYLGLPLIKERVENATALNKNSL